MNKKLIKMKLKHNELQVNRFDTLDFANLYKSAAETNVKLLEIDTVAEKKGKKKKSIESKNIVVKESKNVKKYTNDDYSHENNTGLKDSQALTIGTKKINRNESDFSKPSVSNLRTEAKINENTSPSSVKKRAKNKHSQEPVADIDSTDKPTNLQNIEKKSKPKKRNKSVSFMVDDNEVAIKKTKSNKQSNDEVSISETLIQPRKPKKKTKLKKKCLENKLGGDSNIKIDIKANDAENKENKPKIDMETNANVENDKEIIKKKSRRKSKKHNNIIEIANSGENEEVENKPSQKVHIKKSKKIKYNSQLNEGFDKADGEPVTKSRKKDDKSEVISDLENLKIGDNTHTLTNLLDEMSVVDQKKKKRNKSKKNHETQPNVENTKTELKTSPEKEKWNKRKWNKDKKEYDQNKGLTSVIVENLSINIILNYKKLLTEHFSKFGVVKRVGIAQVYPTEDPKPVFTTNVYFESEKDAKKALQEDNTRFEGNVIRIKESLPPTQTIAVVHSYGELNDQIISSIFSEAGRIRRIRQKVKGKKSKATAFVEFDGPEAVERAIKKAEETKVGGKNIHVSKYQLKPKKDKKKIAMTENQVESDVSND